MADKGQQGFAGMDEERRREIAREGGHASHEKGSAHEFNPQEAADAGRKGAQARQMAHAARETTGESEMRAMNEDRNSGGVGEEGSETGGEPGAAPRAKKTRGGTHDQHVTAGKKGGSRIRELIELGYKYEEEHGIGPGRNDRSKLAARRRSRKGGGDQTEESEPESGPEAE
jgi:general stress protein YciG